LDNAAEEPELLSRELPATAIHPPRTRGPFGPLWHFKDTQDEEKDPKSRQPSQGCESPVCKANEAGKPDDADKEERADETASQVVHLGGRRRVRQAAGRSVLR
jgi:hypothetical protein